jgi:CMP-N-acetylneuraminic acid synthetase
MAKIIALIPARGGSKRVPRKNVLPFHGRPLVQWTVLFAQQTGLFDQIVISTDDPEIMEAATQAGASSFGLRPDVLSHDTATSVDVALYELERAEAANGPYDYVALLQPTSPYRRTERWQEAAALLDQNDEVPSVIGVAPVAVKPYHMFTMSDDQTITPLFPDYLTHRTQDLPPTVAVNGSLYLVRCDVLKKQRSFYFAASRTVSCDDPRENIDIDTPYDFEMAKLHLADTLA